MKNDKEQIEQYFLSLFYREHKADDYCNPVNAIFPFLKKESKILVVNCNKRSIFSLAFKREGFDVEDIYFEEESDFINYPNEKLEAYNYVFFFPFNFRITYVMEKLFSTKVPFIIFSAAKNSLLLNEKRLGMINDNKCELMFFFNAYALPKKYGRKGELIRETNFAFLCRDVLTDKIMSAKIYEDSVELVIPI